MSSPDGTAEVTQDEDGTVDVTQVEGKPRWNWKCRHCPKGGYAATNLRDAKKTLRKHIDRSCQGATAQPDVTEEVISEAAPTPSKRQKTKEAVPAEQTAVSDDEQAQKGGISSNEVPCKGDCHCCVRISRLSCMYTYVHIV